MRFRLNEKQLIAASGLVAYLIAGLIVVVSHLGTFFKVITSKFYLLVPIFKTFSIILVASVIAVYLLRDRKNKTFLEDRN
ncbi:MAG: hypothetical protein COV73_00040 [Candidatus Omnitrophica bacterium CG11_big_fil_rev_8_21_14_0_20_43_6]|nr:MAG: hypothetical protein COV73_00040 [Candidatus Omnitrophica bacterium CG11_big_fil_rev_8_21_14_0_20_43_6]